MPFFWEFFLFFYILHWNHIGYVMLSFSVLVLAPSDLLACGLFLICVLGNITIPEWRRKGLILVNCCGDTHCICFISIAPYTTINLPVTVCVSYFFEVEMTENCQKCHISCNFDQFWDHVTHSKTPYTTNEVH